MDLGNGALTVTEGTGASYAGVIIGSGSLTKTGAGTLTLTGANDYTGGTTVAPARWRGRPPACRGTSTTMPMSPSTRARTAALHRQRSAGSGSLTKSGSGTLTLPAPTTTPAAPRSASARSRGTTDSLKGDIHDNANVTFSQNTNGNYTGSLTGSGSLTKNGNGTVTLLGSNNYGGGTIVNGGTLAGTTVTLQGDILDNANVTFNQSTTGTYSDTISGSGSLTKAGSGTVTLLGDNGYDGRHDHHRGQPAWHHGQPAGRYPHRCQRCQCHLRPERERQLYREHHRQRQPDQGRGRHAELAGGQRLHRRHHGERRTLSGTTVSLDGDISVAAGAHVELDQSAPGTFVGEITGGGSLIKDGTGTVTLNGTNN